MGLQDSLITDIIHSLSRRHDEMVWNALKDYGFSEKYVIEHPNEFRIESVIGSLGEAYYHRDRYLFTFKMETDIDTCETKMVVYYPVNH